jgi:ABC-2 type transport system ATP-binding protein
MKCLNDAQIQAIVDREASPDAVTHAAACRRCEDRVRQFETRASAAERAIAEPAAVPAALAARVREAVDEGAHLRSRESIRSDGGQAAARGATRLRHLPAHRPLWLRAGWSTVAVAALAIVAFVFVIPSIRGPQAVSAAGILAESANRLSQVPASGIELREYELTLDGVPRELNPDHPDGVYRIRQAIDHGKAGRFRFASYTSDGKVLTSIAQDPVTRTRVSLMRVDDQYYRFEFIIPPSDVPSLPEIERLHMEASIKMMQATGQHMLQEIERGGRKLYLIEVPQVNTTNDKAVWDLTHARVLVDAADFRVTEFQASGTFLKQPYSVSYKLISHLFAATVNADASTPSQPSGIVLSGDGPTLPEMRFAALGAARPEPRAWCSDREMVVRDDREYREYLREGNAAARMQRRPNAEPFRDRCTRHAAGDPHQRPDECGPVIGVEDLSLEVEQGEIYGFLGANGAGKTTTIRLLLDLLRPSRGSAHVLGADCHHASLQTRRQVGYLPGELPIYPDLKADAYLAFLAAVDGRPVAPASLQVLLKRFDISKVDLRRRLREHSHGMKRKIGIIQALMAQPPVVILDEPTAGLDPLMAQAFRETLEELRRSGTTTVFLSSHVLSEVETTCDRVGLIRAGRLVTVGTIDDLRRQSPRRVIVRFTRLVDAPVPSLPGVTAVTIAPQSWVIDVAGPVGALVTALAALPVEDMEIESFKLEDYILKLYAPCER